MQPTGLDDVDITGWALAARAGDRTAAAAFIRATQQQVYRFLGHLVDGADTEHLTQETYLRAMRGLPRFSARSSARTWLLAIARRVAADHVRSWRNRTTGAPAPIRPDDGSTEGMSLREMLGTLPPDRREAFVATQVLGLSYAEAAEVCDCPIATIRTRVARARADLVAALPARGRGAAAS
ncbi:RNA polymerase sigma factor SigC [Micromonospora sonneratiae]|uniref:Sigma-70 family RNA polymerase sigma factor n=1 Tax=Micromonospora sonneratiae TaxID=1184706 RepID=A0ABW3Y8U9_9ACTN